MKTALETINPDAARLADAMEERSGRIGVAVTRLASGARLIDAGVRSPGSHEAGRLFAEACLGGLGRVVVRSRPLGPAVLPAAEVAVDIPLVACIASQYAVWRIAEGKFFGLCSGPARALAAAEPLFDRLPLKTRADETVLLLETDALPGDDVARRVATRCGVEPSRLTLVAAATGSLTGSTQIAARSVETALHKLMELGFDLSTIIAGCGICPIAPGHPDMLQAIGRTNDAVLYGSEVSLWVSAADDALQAGIDRLPSRAARDYGRRFVDLFLEHGDFYKIDPMLFSPARVTLVNRATGRVFSAGDPDEATLLRSFGIAPSL